MYQCKTQTLSPHGSTPATTPKNSSPSHSSNLLRSIKPYGTCLSGTNWMHVGKGLRKGFCVSNHHGVSLCPSSCSLSFSGMANRRHCFHSAFSPTQKKSFLKKQPGSSGVKQDSKFSRMDFARCAMGFRNCFVIYTRHSAGQNEVISWEGPPQTSLTSNIKFLEACDVGPWDLD